MINISFWVKNSSYAIETLFYYCFGQTIGRLFYSKAYFKTKYFSFPSALGWRWVTRSFFSQKILRINSDVPWPCSSKILIAHPENIIFQPDDLNNFHTQGVYFQAFAKIIIGRGTYIAPNVGLITQNHDLYNPDERSKKEDVVFGEKCWIGMNSIILPGVTLGSHTVVGANSVVTKSLPDGYCVIAGNPAKIIKKLK